MKKKKLALTLSGVIMILLIPTVVGFNVRERNFEQKKSVLVEKTILSDSSLNNIAKKVDRIESAKQTAREYIGSKDVGVYCIDLKSGKSFGINENKIYYSASTGKLPGILYTQKKLNESIISADTQFKYHDYVNDIPGAMIRE